MVTQPSRLQEAFLWQAELLDYSRLVQDAVNLCVSTCRYVDYLLDALRRRELFLWLELQPATFWHTLLFR